MIGLSRFISRAHHKPKPIAGYVRTFSIVQLTGLCSRCSITSANPQEGKSLTSANLAIAFAQSGQRVILVDADLRRPSQHKVFSLPNKAGLTTVLLDSSVPVSDVVQSVTVENLRVMTSGPLPPNPSEMVGSKRMEHFIDSLRHEADIVIFDSPPVLAVTDSIVLGTRVDGILLVVESGHTRHIQAQRSKEALTKVGAQLLGVVLNRVEVRSENYYSYYEDDLDSRQARRVRLPREPARTRGFARPARPAWTSTTHASKPHGQFACAA